MKGLTRAFISYRIILSAIGLLKLYSTAQDPHHRHHHQHQRLSLQTHLLRQGLHLPPQKCIRRWQTHAHALTHNQGDSGKNILEACTILGSTRNKDRLFSSCFSIPSCTDFHIDAGCINRGARWDRNGISCSACDCSSVCGPFSSSCWMMWLYKVEEGEREKMKKLIHAFSFHHASTHIDLRWHLNKQTIVLMISSLYT